MTNVDDFLARSSGDLHPAFKFTNIGDTLAGTIVEEPRTVTTPNIQTKAPEEKLIVAVQDDAGNVWALWVKSGFMARALHAATKSAGARLAQGGKLVVRFSEERDTGKPQPAKVFEAIYKPPAVSADDVSGTNLEDLI